MRYFGSVLLVAGLVFVSGQDDTSCRDPAPDKDFNLSKFYGVWYETGRIQTEGGDFWQRDCHCTFANVTANNREGAAVGDSFSSYNCRYGGPKEDWAEFGGELTKMGPPGRWDQKFGPLSPDTVYTVVYQDEQYALQYDCNEPLGLFTNYCIHLMSRKPTMPEEVRKRLVAIAENLNLNPEGRKYTETPHAQCW